MTKYTMRHVKRAMAAALTGTMILGMGQVGTYAAVIPTAISEAGGFLQTIPATGPEEAVQKPFHNQLKNADGILDDYYKVVYSGYFDISMTYDNLVNRDLRMYIPQDSRYSQTTIFLMVPSGTDPYQFMVDSGWKAVADKEKATIYLLMPQRVIDSATGTAQNWGSWGSEDEVLTYIAKAIDTAGQRPGIQTVSYCFYGVGYGDGADYMTRYIMKNPTKLAGGFSVGSTGGGAELIDAMRQKPSAEAGVMTSQISVPFGLVTETHNDSTQALVDYFKTANKTVSYAAPKDGFFYYAPDQKADTRYPDSEPVAGVYYQVASIDACESETYAQKLYDILEPVRRYPGYQNTELRAYEDVYDYANNNYEYYTSLTANGRYTYGGDIHQRGDGEYYNREWWLYVPDSAKDRMSKGEKVETLFLFMGSNGYGDEVPQRTGWDSVADKEGFIIISPSGHVRHQGNFGNFDRNGVDVYQYCTNWRAGSATAVLPDDLLMIDDIYSWLFTASPYAGGVDASRVYASGQSAGGKFAHEVAKYRPQYFAASAPSSWVDSGEGADTSSDVAMVVMMGQKDNTIKGALSTENAQKMFTYYNARYGGLKDNAGRSAWTDFTFMQEPNGGTSVCSETDGVYNQYILKTENGVPMLVGLEVVGLTHATIPTECEYAWKIMSHFSKDAATKVLYYDGAVVDTPVSSGK